MHTDRPTRETHDPKALAQYYRNADIASNKGVQTYLTLTGELKEKYGLFDHDIEDALKHPRGFLSRVRTGNISHPDYYYNFKAYCTRLSELLSKCKRREFTPRSFAVDSEVFEEFLAYLRDLFQERYDAIIAECGINPARLECYRNGTARIPQDQIGKLENAWGAEKNNTKQEPSPLTPPTPRSPIQRESPQLQQRVESTFIYEFPEEWFSSPYAEAIATCTTTFDCAYIQGIAKVGNYNITRSAELAGIDRKHFKKLLNKYDGKPLDFNFTLEELSRPFSELKQEWVNDFKRQYVARAIDQEKTITGASKAIGVDRGHLRRLKRRLIDGGIQK